MAGSPKQDMTSLTREVFVWVIQVQVFSMVWLCFGFGLALALTGLWRGPTWGHGPSPHFLGYVGLGGGDNSNHDPGSPHFLGSRRFGENARDIFWVARIGFGDNTK